MRKGALCQMLRLTVTAPPQQQSPRAERVGAVADYSRSAPQWLCVLSKVCFLCSVSPFPVAECKSWSLVVIVYCAYGCSG